jgi:hypothetical protein
LPSPLYVAVMACAPTERFGTENEALPPLKGKLVINGLLPSKTETVPVAVGGVTVAVMMTDCPTTDGLGVEATVMGVVDVTTCVRAREVLPPNAPSPL